MFLRDETKIAKFSIGLGTASGEPNTACDVASSIFRPGEGERCMAHCIFTRKSSLSISMSCVHYLGPNVGKTMGET